MGVGHLADLTSAVRAVTNPGDPAVCWVLGDGVPAGRIPLPRNGIVMAIFSRRALTRIADGAAAVGASLSVGVLDAPSAGAARCATAGHAYLTQPGRTIFSGFEGDQRFGVPMVTYAQGAQSFRLGGNGISPGSGVDFFAFDRNTVVRLERPSGTVDPTAGAAERATNGHQADARERQP